MTEPMAMVRVKLTDQEWRVKCEELAKAELRRKERRGVLAAEADDWKERRKDLEGQIDTISDLCERLAKEVESHEGEIPAQQTIPGAVPEAKCNGDHGGPPCGDPECWAIDGKAPWKDDDKEEE